MKRMWFCAIVTVVSLTHAASAQTTWYVDDDTCPAPGDGSQANPFCRIQDGLNAASAGDVVSVLPGVYFEHVVLKAGVDLIGSGAASTTIDAGGFGTAVLGADGALLSGFTITNAGGLNERAVDCYNSSPVIANNVITGNTAIGVLLYQSDATVIDNVIEGNSSFSSGCPCNPMLCMQSSPAILRNHIIATDPNGNLDAIELGYVNYNMPRSFLVEDNLIEGMVFLDDIQSNFPLHNVIRGNVILGGTNITGGFNIAFSPNAGTIVNNTLVGGWGFFLQGNSTVSIVDNIVAFGQRGLEVFSGTADFRNNDVFGNTQDYSGIPDQTGLNGNLSVDPRFWNSSGGDYRLRPGSPCIDAGDASLPHDPDGSPGDIGYRAFDPLYAPISTYCAGKVNSQGCTPEIGWSGLPSVTSGSPFLITASMVIPGRVGLLLYGLAPDNAPFQGGTLCLLAPYRRSSGQIALGSGTCGGSYAMDFNQLLQGGSHPLLPPGVIVYAQWWQRDPNDPAGFSSGLTNALSFGIAP